LMMQVEQTAGGRRGGETVVQEVFAGAGAGLLAYDSDALIQFNTFSDNACGMGGAMFLVEDRCEVSHNTIIRNEVVGEGGAICMIGSRAHAHNNVIANNLAGSRGGGVFISRGGQLHHNTIINNEASFEGGGNLYAYSLRWLTNDPFPPTVITHNILAGATDGYGAYLNIAAEGDRFAYNNVFGNEPENYTGHFDWTGYENNVSIKPGFVDAAVGDYHLLATSPCIDAGEATAAVLYDIDGKARRVGEAVDIGADEFAGNRNIAKAGWDQSLSRTGSVTLDGSASFFEDPNGTQLFKWTQIAGPNAVLADANASTTSFMADLEGDYYFDLVVSDGVVDSRPDTVWIRVKNHTPVANAGSLQSGTEYPVTITLDGSASVDLDGDVLSYLWTQMGDSSVTIIDANQPQAYAYIEEPGRYSFGLRVADGLAKSEWETVDVVVGNTAPVA
ncbi:MAG: PKD domain-containing protein, partial [Desulfobacterales bacterium]|nr:PKD domain-containing protein [Desulfobacterales bacterium]